MPIHISSHRILLSLLAGVVLLGLVFFLRNNQNPLPIPNLDGTSAGYIPSPSLAANSTFEQNNAYYHFIDEPSDLTDILWTDRKGEIDADGKKHFLFIDVTPAFGITGPTHPFDLIFGKDKFDPCFDNANRINDFWFYVYEGDETAGNLHDANYGISPCAAWAGLFPQYTSSINDMPLVEPGDRIHLFLDPQEHQKFTDRSATPRIAYTPPPSGPQCSDAIDNDGDGGIDVPGSLVVTQLDGENVLTNRTCVFSSVCQKYLHLGVLDKKLYMLGDELLGAPQYGRIHVADFEGGVFHEDRLILPVEEGMFALGNPFGRGPVDEERKILYISYSPHPVNSASGRIYKVDVSGDLPEVVGMYIADENEKMIRLDKQMTHDDRYLYAQVQNDDSGTSRFIKIDTDSMTVVNSLDDVVFHLPFYWADRSTIIDVEQKLAFLIQEQTIVRVDLEDFSVAEQSASLASGVRHLAIAGDRVLVSTYKRAGVGSLTELIVLNATTLSEQGRYVISNGSMVTIGEHTFDTFNIERLYTDSSNRAIAYILPCNSGGRCGHDEDRYLQIFALTDTGPQSLEKQHPLEYSAYGLLSEPHVGLVRKDGGMEDRGFASLDLETLTLGDVHPFVDEFGENWAEHIYQDGSENTFVVMKRHGDEMRFYPPFSVNLGDPQCTAPEGSES